MHGTMISLIFLFSFLPRRNSLIISRSPPSQLNMFQCTDREVIFDSSFICERSLLPIQNYKGTIKIAEASKRNVCLDQGTLSEGKASRQEKTALKFAAENRASKPLTREEHLHILYMDEYICVINKPSGVLSVPGVRRNPSVAGLVFDLLKPQIDMDQMVVHRLDMDTSGILVFALTEFSLKELHEAFRSRKVKKSYLALLCGHLSDSEVEIDVGLERDPHNPPFMRVAQARIAKEIDTVHESFRKFVNQAPKPSLTDVRVLSREWLYSAGVNKLPVTRVELTPHTGRTHQLRVHAASLGHPIVGDDIYGYMGEGNCGIDYSTDKDLMKTQQEIYKLGLPLCLHASRLTFLHPVTGSPVSFESEAPFP